MQKLVFFIDSNDKDYGVASNIGNLYMNRFIIDEDAGHEISKIFESEGLRQKLEELAVEVEEQIGMGHIIIFFNFWNISLFTLSSIALNLSYGILIQDS